MQPRSPSSRSTWSRTSLGWRSTLTRTWRIRGGFRIAPPAPSGSLTTARAYPRSTPAPAGSPPGTTSTPTGQVFNGSTDFVVTKGAASGPSRFIFATEDGTISGWNPTVDGAHAILAVDNSVAGAIYKGLAIGSNASG